MKKPFTLIAIDPDVDKSGVATYDGIDLQLFNFPLWEVFKLLKEVSFSNYLVLIECSWKIKNTSWHGGGKGAARNVGRNQEIGRQIEKYCIEHKIKYQLIEPKGYSSVSHEQFLLRTKTNFKKTNPETRVAGLFAVNYWGGYRDAFKIEKQPKIISLAKDMFKDK